VGIDAEDAAAMRELRRQANELGYAYREAINNGQPDCAAALAAQLVLALAKSIPPENEPAHDILLNLVAALEENLAGKDTHPIIAGRLPNLGVEQLGFRGVLVWGLAVAGILFLEQEGLSKERACKAVSRILGSNGVPNCTLSTVKNWRRRADERQFLRGGGPAGEWGLRFAPIVADEFAHSKVTDPVVFLSRWLSAKIEGVSSTLP